jgi:glycolate oxidase
VTQVLERAEESPVTVARTDSLVVALEAIVGARHVRRTIPERVTYATDGIPTHRRVPGLVVLPGSRDEVIAIIRALAERGVPFVPRGAGTGPRAAHSPHPMRSCSCSPASTVSCKWTR